jgi:subtilase family serine protease
MSFSFNSLQSVKDKAIQVTPLHFKCYMDTAITPLTTPPEFFSGTSLKTIYNVPPIIPVLGKKKASIAIVIAYTYPKLQQDLNTYWTSRVNTFNLICPTLYIHTMRGATQHSGWAKESCLDVQMVCSMNPYATIYVVEAKSSSAVDLLSAVTYATKTLKVDVVSMSWGTSDLSQLTRYNSTFSSPTTCFCASSGNTNTVSWPSVLSTCISVGGTTLSSFGPIHTEFTWPSAGCGYSTTINKPTFQNNVNKTNKRSIPDVSLTANPSQSVYMVYEGKWYGLGGTSVSTPLLAGMLSCIIQARYNAGKPALNSTSILNYMYTIIYAHPSKYSSCFFDITQGSDSGYNATSRYDIPTGLGSPNCAHLINECLNI